MHKEGTHGEETNTKRGHIEKGDIYRKWKNMECNLYKGIT